MKVVLGCTFGMIQNVIVTKFDVAVCKLSCFVISHVVLHACVNLPQTFTSRHHLAPHQARLNSHELDHENKLNDAMCSSRDERLWKRSLRKYERCEFRIGAAVAHVGERAIGDAMRRVPRMGE